MKKDKYGLTRTDYEGLEKLGKLHDEPDTEKRMEVLKNCWNTGTYIVRHKVLEIFKHVEIKGAEDFLAGVAADSDQEEEFRLHSIQTLAALKIEDSVESLKPLLYDPDPFIVKGTVIAMGRIGGSTGADALFSFAVSPGGRLVKREIFREAVSLALSGMENPRSYIQNRVQRDARIRLFLQGMDLEPPFIPRFDVYPANDYLAEKVKRQGIDYKRFKYLVEE